VTLRLDVGGRATLGPGKIRLLELIRELGSISAAGREMGMSYRRAWMLIESLNATFTDPLVATRPGGARGGGADLLPSGEEVVRLYRVIEAGAVASGAAPLGRLQAMLRDATATGEGP
jgi:molybdate transport system regulatory protein